MSHKLRLSLLATATATAFMAMSFLPYQTLAAQHHPHAVSVQHERQIPARSMALCGVLQCDYMDIYNEGAQTIPNGQNVTFNTPDAASTLPAALGAITYTPPGVLNIVNAGITPSTYLVTFVITAMQANQFALVYTPVTPPGAVTQTIFQSNDLAVPTVGHKVITVPALSAVAITLKNVSTYSVDLLESLVPGNPVVNAVVTVQQLS
jgi:hypothetical protein